MAVEYKTLIKKAIQLSKPFIIIALLLSPIRYGLELLGLPEYSIFIIGLLWLSLGFAIYLGWKLTHHKQAHKILFISLVIYSPISRIPVAILWWVDTNWEIGTHYGEFYDSFVQALLNHVIYGSIIQIIPGFIFGALTIMLMRYKANALQDKILENE